MSFNLADLFEAVVDAIGDRTAVVAGDRRLTYRELEDRANRLAHVLDTHGIGPGDHVGLQLMNGAEYLEGMLAAFKLRAVPINVNYRYVEGELRYLFADSSLKALLYHRSFAPRIAAVTPDVPELQTFLVVDDDSAESAVPGSIKYETALAGAPAVRPDPAQRTSDDLYCVYTGGTTGMPKGVVWRHEDIFKAAMGGGDVAQTGNYVSGAEELAARAASSEQQIIALAAPPLMHSSAHWLAFHQLFTGGTVVMTPLGRFDAKVILETIAREKVFLVVLVGDAMLVPLLDELEAEPDRYDTSTLWVFGSGGAALSQASKDRLLRLLPNRMIADSFGSSETGVLGAKASGSTFVVNAETAVLDDDGRPVEPGSGRTGRLARKGHVPLRYHNDPEKTAKTFLQIAGERWSLPGDMATVEADASITLLGRGSLSINTGGEKVFPEEVEAPLREHPGVADAVVVGVPDDRWGERVVAVVQPSTQPSTQPPTQPPTLEQIQQHCRAHLAGYKIPRDLVIVERIVRSPAGKADYAWAKEQAVKALT